MVNRQRNQMDCHETSFPVTTLPSNKTLRRQSLQPHGPHDELSTPLFHHHVTMQFYPPSSPSPSVTLVVVCLKFSFFMTNSCGKKKRTRLSCGPIWLHIEMPGLDLVCVFLFIFEYEQSPDCRSPPFSPSELVYRFEIGQPCTIPASRHCAWVDFRFRHIRSVGGYGRGISQGVQMHTTFIPCGFLVGRHWRRVFFIQATRTLISVAFQNVTGCCQTKLQQWLTSSSLSLSALFAHDWAI